MLAWARTPNPSGDALESMLQKHSKRCLGLFRTSIKNNLCQQRQPLRLVYVSDQARMIGNCFLVDTPSRWTNYADLRAIAMRACVFRSISGISELLSGKDGPLYPSDLSVLRLRTSRTAIARPSAPTSMSWTCPAVPFTMDGSFAMLWVISTLAPTHGVSKIWQIFNFVWVQPCNNWITVDGLKSQKWLSRGDCCLQLSVYS
eukprot:6207047-Pleurochrysis_carterae.AAC.1